MATPAAKHPIRFVTLAAIPFLPVTALEAQDPPRLGTHPIADVVRALTVQEKVRLVLGMGSPSLMPGGPAMDPDDAKVPEKVPGAAGRTHAVPRLGIPSLTLSDGPAGVRIDPTRADAPGRSFHATAFPVATLLAASWDTALVREVGGAFGREAREYGVDILLAPGMNIHRNPLGGRNFEYYAEDPLLSGHMAAAWVTGVQAEGVGTSLKHFAANNQEFNRMQSDTRVSRRALREIYLRGFAIAVRRAQPWTVMSAYNLINGTRASESRELLTTVLREEWGFTGLVTSDWFAGRDAVAQMRAGNDLLMPGHLRQQTDLLEAVASGRLREAQLDTNVARVLGVVARSPAFRQYVYSDRPDLPAHARIARGAAADGMVLLQNDGGALPLPAAGTVALFGIASYDLVVGGTGSGDVNEAYAVSLDGALEEAGYGVVATLRAPYREYIAEQRARQEPPPMPLMPVPPIPELPVEAALPAALARTADLAIVTIGRSSGEFEDRDLETDFLLNDTERALLRDVSRAFRGAGKKVVVVLNVGGVVETASWRDQADAILLAWLPGQEGGHAIADVLRGVVNPSGRLPMTFPVAYDDVPSATNFPGRPLRERRPDEPAMFGVPTEVTYDEGIYVGYRYYGTFGVEPAYPFGHGLSYTRFDYGAPAVRSDPAGDAFTVTAAVRNAGSVPGREVVQLYVSAPRGRLDKPERELRGFAKTALLAPGASETVRFTLTPADLASFHTDRTAWIAEAGTYTARLAASARDIRGAVSFTLPREVVVEQVHDVLAPEAPIRERTPRTR